VDRLVREGRSFRKGLRYNLGGDHASVSTVLTDAEAGAVAMYVVPSNAFRSSADREEVPILGQTTDRWIWIVDDGSMPAIPERVGMRVDTIN